MACYIILDGATLYKMNYKEELALRLWGSKEIYVSLKNYGIIALEF